MFIFFPTTCDPPDFQGSKDLSLAEEKRQPTSAAVIANSSRKTDVSHQRQNPLKVMMAMVAIVCILDALPGHKTCGMCA
ncbi:hypothetical protein I7I53_02270 [Histoplasma capsulatum var. duboisii H88]|uniref:Uncharacterized protein n=1 Tax=Ajellomyces capsulatus (strain H88) TaxID=544711 RepID=A0A8A1LNJ5_AJEC8|nr:hypothetical protein I7I53_02270 [Histoplasma capsulatum var. duboisii H88]